MLITVFGYLYTSVFMTMHTLSWSQLADVDTDVSSINTAAEATTVSNKLYLQGIGGGRKFSLGGLGINIVRKAHENFQPHPLK